jgi:molybdopterin-guanine dinucleotide biosynthesis protein A
MIDAVVIAGGQPKPGEPLYEETQGGCKAMLDLAGKPMVQWVLDALSGSAQVRSIFIVGLSSEHSLHSNKPLEYLPDRGGMIENITSGMHRAHGLHPDSEYFLLVSSDIPGIRSEMVDWVIDSATRTKQDACYNVIRKEVMEARYPSSRRSYVRLKDMTVCGGDMNVVSSRIVLHDETIWQKIVAARKNAVKQAALIGFDTLILMLLRAVSLEKTAEMISKRLGMHGRAVVCPFAEVGMDVDKPFQLEIMREDLLRHTQAVTPIQS